ncbi:MAG: hypothetical protein PHW96_02955 [Candidatus Nanoarchaeia archaeon]|nr:hypothetical protein [Candidatus Nanoarchaeia archaeon]
MKSYSKIEGYCVLENGKREFSYATLVDDEGDIVGNYDNEGNFTKVVDKSLIKKQGKNIWDIENALEELCCNGFVLEDKLKNMLGLHDFSDRSDYLTNPKEKLKQLLLEDENKAPEHNLSGVYKSVAWLEHDELVSFCVQMIDKYYFHVKNHRCLDIEELKHFANSVDSEKKEIYKSKLKSFNTETEHVLEKILSELKSSKDMNIYKKNSVLKDFYEFIENSIKKLREEALLSLFPEKLIEKEKILITEITDGIDYSDRTPINQSTITIDDNCFSDVMEHMKRNSFAFTSEGETWAEREKNKIMRKFLGTCRNPEQIFIGQNDDKRTKVNILEESIDGLCNESLSSGNDLIEIYMNMLQFDDKMLKDTAVMLIDKYYSHRKSFLCLDENEFNGLSQILENEKTRKYMTLSGIIYSSSKSILKDMLVKLKEFDLSPYKENKAVINFFSIVKQTIGSLEKVLKEISPENMNNFIKPEAYLNTHIFTNERWEIWADNIRYWWNKGEGKKLNAFIGSLKNVFSKKRHKAIL